MDETELEQWADLLSEGFGAHDPGPTLIRLDRAASGDHELALRPIDVHPVEALAALKRPVDCGALGVAIGGWAAPLGPTRPSAHPDAERVFQIALVNRDGFVVSRLRYPDGTVIKEPPATGAVLDALRTALGLAPAA